jgi:DNA-binding transcriptional MocR family regulator
MLRMLDKHLQGVDFIRPEGGFFLSLNLPEEINGRALQENAENFGIVLSDGSGFFVDGKGDNFVRLPFCGFLLEEIEEGIKRLASAIDHYRIK